MKINKEQWQKMKEHYELGVPITRIAARNDLAVPTCRRYLMMDEKEYDEFAASQIPYMDSYREFIIDKLKTNPQLQNTNNYYYLKEAFSDFECPKTTFHKYMQTLRQELGGIYVRQRVTSIRKPLPPGYEAQADFGQFAMQSMYGERVRVYFFCMTMSYSRMHFVYFSAEPFTTKAAIEAKVFTLSTSEQSPLCSDVLFFRRAHTIIERALRGIVPPQRAKRIRLLHILMTAERRAAGKQESKHGHALGAAAKHDVEDAYAYSYRKNGRYSCIHCRALRRVCSQTQGG